MRITAHKQVNGQLLYQCEWMDWLDSNNVKQPGRLSGFQPIDDFLPAMDLIQEYWISKGLEPLNIKGRAGATGDQVQEDNLIPMDKILSTITKIRSTSNFKNATNIPVLEFEDPQFDFEAIYILLMNRHAYVIYNHPERAKLIISDGANMTLDELVQKDIEKTVRPKLFDTHLFLQQSTADHCASIAVAIVLAMIRALTKDGNVPLLLQTSQSLMADIKKRLHQMPSAATKELPAIALLRKRCDNRGVYLPKRGANLHKCK